MWDMIVARDRKRLGVTTLVMPLTQPDIGHSPWGWMAEERGSIEIRASDFRPEGKEGEKSAGQNRVPHCRGHGETDMHRVLGVGSHLHACNPAAGLSLESGICTCPTRQTGMGIWRWSFKLGQNRSIDSRCVDACGSDGFMSERREEGPWGQRRPV